MEFFPFCSALFILLSHITFFCLHTLLAPLGDLPPASSSCLKANFVNFLWQVMMTHVSNTSSDLPFRLHPGSILKWSRWATLLYMAAAPSSHIPEFKVSTLWQTCGKHIAAPQNRCLKVSVRALHSTAGFVRGITEGAVCTCCWVPHPHGENEEPATAPVSFTPAPFLLYLQLPNPVGEHQLRSLKHICI